MDAVLFDFNGVLVDDEHLHFEAFNEVLAPLGVTMTEALYQERYLGFDDRGCFTAVLTDQGRAATDELVRGLIASKAEVYARRAERELRVFPGAAALVRAVSERVPVAVVSGALRAEIEGALSLMDVRGCVTHIIAAEDVRACKPDPEGYSLGLALLQRLHSHIRAERVVALEDSVAGVESARAAGLIASAVAHTYDEATLRRAGAVRVFPTVADASPDALSALARGTARP